MTLQVRVAMGVFTVGATATVVAALWGIAPARGAGPSGHSDAVCPFDPPAASEYSYGEGGSAGALNHEGLNPGGGADSRLKCMAQRLSRVVGDVEGATNARCVVVLGVTDRTATTRGDGVIVVDVATATGLGDDALACLIAHEIGHEVLNHRAKLDRGNANRDPTSQAQNLRELESAADTFAGRAIALAGYSPEGFREMLQHVRSTAWDPAIVRQYYPHPMRMVSFEQGYREGIQETASKRASGG